jgi:hypothetical protein
MAQRRVRELQKFPSMKNILTLFFAMIAVLFAGCGHVPVKTITTGPTTYVDAMMVGRTMLAPSRVTVTVSNFSSGCFMDLRMGSRLVIEKLSPGNVHTVVPPESPFRDGQEIFIATIYTMEGGQKKIVAFTERYIPMNGPLTASFVAQNKHIRSHYQIAYAGYRYY